MSISLHQENARQLVFQIERHVRGGSNETIDWRGMRSMTEDLDWECYNGHLPSRASDLHKAIAQQDRSMTLKELDRIIGKNAGYW